MLPFGFWQQLASTWKTQHPIWAKYALCAVVFVLLVVGCGSETHGGSQPAQNGSQQSQAIRGKWIGPCNVKDLHLKQVEFLSEFLSDGTFRSAGVAGTYSFIDTNRIKFTYSNVGTVYG
jgi:hypothetical protein